VHETRSSSLSGTHGLVRTTQTLFVTYDLAHKRTVLTAILGHEVDELGLLVPTLLENPLDAVAIRNAQPT
jgi:hypothetical protein